jgi:hypothetical protein
MTDEENLRIWAIGLIVIILMKLLRDEYSISLQELAGLSVLLIIVSIMLHALKTRLKRKENETSSLALEELT